MVAARSHRYAVLLAGLSLLAVLACGSPPPGAGETAGTPPTGAPPAPPEASAAPIKVRMSQPVDALSFTSVYVARHHGYFADEGLEVEIFTTGGGGPDTQVLIAGDVQFNITAPSQLITAYQEGAPLLGVVSILNRVVVNAVMHREVAQARGIGPTTPLRDKLAALRGLTVGATRPGALTYQLALYFIRKAGLTPGDDVGLLGVGSGTAMIAALEQRKVDVIFNSPPEPQEAIRQGIGVMFIDNTAGEDPDLADFLQQVLLVRADYAREHPEIVRRMVRALVRANRWVNEHSAEELASLLREYFSQMPEETLLESVRAVRAAVPPDGRMTERGLLINYDMMELAGTLKGRPPWTALLTNEYLPQ
ncbi:MAG TPA: ABC transporter substrate-binding protein [Chloroflexota bacterium]|nr:ABC transporter substrate-binding protein [Chloroflexota bacterium]